MKAERAATMENRQQARPGFIDVQVTGDIAPAKPKFIKVRVTEHSASESTPPIKRHAPKVQPPVTIEMFHEIAACRGIALSYAGREDFCDTMKSLAYKACLALTEYEFFLMNPVSFPIHRTTKSTALYWMKHCQKMRDAYHADEAAA